MGFNNKNSRIEFEDELDPDKLMMCGRDRRLRNVTYEESNRNANKSVWQGDLMYKDLNDNYNLNVEELDDDEVLMLEGRFLDPDRDSDNYTEAEIKKFTQRFVVKKISENKCHVYQLNYKEAVNVAEENSNESESNSGF